MGKLSGGRVPGGGRVSRGQGIIPRRDMGPEIPYLPHHPLAPPTLNPSNTKVGGTHPTGMIFLNVNPRTNHI